MYRDHKYGEINNVFPKPAPPDNLNNNLKAQHILGFKLVKYITTGQAY